MVAPQTQHLKPEERDSANRIFDDIVREYEPIQEKLESKYKPITLIRVTKDEVSQTDEFLMLFFRFLQRMILNIDEEDCEDIGRIVSHLDDIRSLSAKQKSALGRGLADFCASLIDSFFLPCEYHPPSSSDKSHDSVISTTVTPEHDSYEIDRMLERCHGTPEYLWNLRQSCYTRDRHRCVVSRAYDWDKARELRAQNHTEEFVDDMGQPRSETNPMDWLVVAYIIPRTFMTRTAQESDMGVVSESRLF